MNTGEARLMSLTAPNDVSIRIFQMEGDNLFVALVGPEELHVLFREQLLFGDQGGFSAYHSIMLCGWFPGCIGETPAVTLQALTERLAAMPDEAFDRMSNRLMHREWPDGVRPEADDVLHCTSFVEFAEVCGVEA